MVYPPEFSATDPNRLSTRLTEVHDVDRGQVDKAAIFTYVRAPSSLIDDGRHCRRGRGYLIKYDQERRASKSYGSERVCSAHDTPRAAADPRFSARKSYLATQILTLYRLYR